MQNNALLAYRIIITKAIPLQLLFVYTLPLSSRVFHDYSSQFDHSNRYEDVGSALLSPKETVPPP